MILPTYIRIATASLRANRIRTALTTLGIVIGVAAITCVLAMGAGIQRTVSTQVANLDGNLIVVKPGQTSQADISSYNPYNTAITTTLTERDYATAAKIDNVEAIAPLMLIGGSVKNGTQAATKSPIIGTSPSLPDVLNLDIRSGQFISDTTMRDTTAIGEMLAIELYGTNQAMGQSLTIKGRPHTVIGIVKATNKPINITGVDLDHAVFVSMDDAKSFNQGIAQIQQLNIRTADASQLESTTGKIQSALLKNHSGEQDFAVLSGDAVASNADSFFQSIVIVTTAIAMISLVVGGVGIMNSMLVGVTERTREIGIRKALGATNSQILLQFLIEALIICFVGGLIGVTIAYIIAYFISAFYVFEPVLSWQIIASGFGLALIVGVTFGMYPAAKAARKDPIDALRHYQ